MFLNQIKLTISSFFSTIQKHSNNTNISYQKIIFFFSVITLLFSITNFVPFSGSLVLLVFFTPILGILYFSKHHSLSSAYIFAALMLLYFLIDILTYDKEGLVKFSFFRRDGNVFISFAPLMVLSLLSLKIRPERIIRHFILFATGLNFVLLILWKAKILLVRVDYHFLFIAHNAAGGFIASLIALSAGYLLKKRNFFWASIFSFNFFTLLLTRSRGSILGLVTAFIIFGFMGKFLRRSSIIFIFVAHIIVVVLGYNMSNSDSYMNDIEIVDALDVGLGRQDNIMSRLFKLWPRAIYLFRKSPIIGTGYGSFNDIPYELEKVAPMIYRNTKNIKRYNSAHAHHSFLHIMAENGIIGLFTFILCLLGISKTIKNLPYPEVSLGLLICHWAAIFASLTEHRYFTPAQMLPFFICLGLTIAARNGLKEDKLNDKKNIS